MFRKNVLNKQENEILLREIYRNHFSFFAENDPSHVASLCDIFIEYSWQDFFKFSWKIVGEVISL